MLDNPARLFPFQDQDSPVRMVELRRSRNHVCRQLEGASGSSYSHRVEDLTPGRHRFRLRHYDLDGTSAVSQQVEVTVELPGAFEMSPVYPNPFNPRATFQLSVARDQYVRAEVVDQLGQRAAVLHDGQLSSAGTHTLAIESTGLVSGVYVVRVIGETFTAARPFVYLK